MPLLDDKTLSGAPAAGNDPFNRIADSFKEMKTIIELLSQMRGQNLGQAVQGVSKQLPAGQAGGLGDILKMLSALGLADMPIGQILEKIAPYSVNQLRELGEKYANQSQK